MTDKRNIEELATAAERLLATTPEERQDPRTWFGRVDALKLAIKVARGEIPHGHDERATDSRVGAQKPTACDDDRMEKISALIARLQSVLDQWGDTCVYIRRGGLSWGAVALNRCDDDKKHGVFDLQAQHDRDIEQRVGQVERLIADRNRWMERAMEAEKPSPSTASSAWLPIETAPRGREAVLLKFKDHIPNEREDLRRWDGLMFVGRYISAVQEWGFAAPVGMGGFPDEWFDGWQLLPTPKNNADTSQSLISTERADG